MKTLKGGSLISSSILTKDIYWNEETNFHSIEGENPIWKKGEKFDLIITPNEEEDHIHFYIYFGVGNKLCGPNDNLSRFVELIKLDII